MSLEPITPINLIDEINNNSTLLEFPKIRVDKKLFQSLEEESSDNKPLDIVDIDKRSKKMSKAGMRKVKSEVQNQQNISCLLSSTLQNNEKILPYKSDRELLEKAINANNQEIIDLLWKYGENEYWMPALHYAVYLDEKIDVINLLNFGADPNLISKHAGGNALDVALNKATQSRDLSLANILMNYNGTTDFDNAIRQFSLNNYLEGLEWLFYEKNIEMSDNEKREVLWTIFTYWLYDLSEDEPNTKIIKLLLEQGADCKSQHKWTYCNNPNPSYELCGLLTPAIKQGNIETVKLLIEYGAPIDTHLATKDNPTANSRYNPLWSAVAENKPEIVRLLLEAGATMLTSFYWQNPLTNKIQISNNDLLAFAVVQYDRFNLDMMKILIEYGHPVDFPIQFGLLREYQGSSPLQYAISMKNIDALELLLSSGADPNYSGVRIPPIKLAVQIGDQRIINLLLKYGADIEKA